MLNKKTVFSGIQPTGGMHLGNYIGAISNWVKLQKEDYNNIYCIVDLHAITVFQKPEDLRNNTIEMASFLIACGIDIQSAILFTQSSNPNHSELAWVLNCIARIGWLNRMTQFKDKAGKDKEKSSVGLYVYPNLQAADILLYNTNIVPVGEDQKQHIELCRDIALKFNHDYGSNIFTIPEPLIIANNARVMSLRDASKKMSKSDSSEASRIMFKDSDDIIKQKIIKARTDSGVMPTTQEELLQRPEVANLIKILSFASGLSISAIINQYAGNSFIKFKQDLATSLISIIKPIRDKQDDLLKNKDYILDVLKKGADRSKEVSDFNMTRVKKIVGFVQ